MAWLVGLVHARDEAGPVSSEEHDQAKVLGLAAHMEAVYPSAGCQRRWQGTTSPRRVAIRVPRRMARAARASRGLSLEGTVLLPSSETSMGAEFRTNMEGGKNFDASIPRPYPVMVGVGGTCTCKTRKEQTGRRGAGDSLIREGKGAAGEEQAQAPTTRGRTPWQAHSSHLSWLQTAAGPTVSSPPMTFSIRTNQPVGSRASFVFIFGWKRWP